MYALEIENAKELLAGARRIERIIRRVTGGVIEGAGYEVMELLDAGAIDVGTREMAARLNLETSTVSRSLKAMIGAEYVERRWTESARVGHSKKVASLTPKGRQVLGLVRAAIIADDAKRMSEYDDNDEEVG